MSRFQKTLFIEHHKVFDNYRSKNILYGELVWNFVDFMTAEGNFVLFFFAMSTF